MKELEKRLISFLIEHYYQIQKDPYILLMEEYIPDVYTSSNLE